MGIHQAKILASVAMPSSRRSSQPRDQTQVSCAAGGLFTSWATRENHYGHFWASLVALYCACNSEDTGSIPESGRSPGRGHGNTFQYFCLENPRDREAWWTTVHRVAKNQTLLKWLRLHASMHACMHKGISIPHATAVMESCLKATLESI